MALYFLAPGQPVFSSCHGDSKLTSAFTIPERKEFADANGRRQTGNIPACIDHAGGEFAEEDSVFRVPSDKQIGRLVDTFVKSDGQMLHSVEIFHEYPEIANQIKADIVSQKRPWGISLGTDVVELAGTPFIVKKDITHIGITPNPQYGDTPDGGQTWIHLAAETAADFYRGLKEKVLDKYPDMYMAPETRERLGRLFPKAALGQSESPAPMKPDRDAVAAGTAFPPVDAAPRTMSTEQVPPATPAVVAPAPAPTAAPAPAPTAAPVVDNNAAARYAAFEKEFGSLLDVALVDKKNLMGDKHYSAHALRNAERLAKEIEELTEGRGLKDIPEGATMSHTWLRGFIGSSREVLKTHADELNVADVAMTMRSGLDNPAQVRIEPLDIAKTLFASRERSLHNAETYRLKVEAESAKYNAVLQDLENYKKNEPLKDAEIARLQKELSENKARATIATTMPPAVNTTVAALGVAGAPSGATAAGIKLNTVSAGASRDTGAPEPLGMRPLRVAPAFSGPNGHLFNAETKNQMLASVWAHRSTTLQ